MTEILDFYFVITILAQCILCVLFPLSNGFGLVGVAWLNPVWLYKTIKVNWFGATLIALIGTIAFPLYAFFYWIYKLCTVGRKNKEDEKNE